MKWKIIARDSKREQSVTLLITDNTQEIITLVSKLLDGGIIDSMTIKKESNVIAVSNDFHHTISKKDEVK